MSGYNDPKGMIHLAITRLLSIVLGSAISICISLIVSPVWAGDDMHDNICNDLKNISFLQGFGLEAYNSDNCKTALSSEADENSLNDLAWWEGVTDIFRFNHPRKQNSKIAKLTRECARYILTLDGYVNLEFQGKPSELVKQSLESGFKMSLEAGKALKELESCFKSTECYEYNSNFNFHLDACKKEVETFYTMLESSSLRDLSNFNAVNVIAMVGILQDVIKSIEAIAVGMKQSLPKESGVKKDHV